MDLFGSDEEKEEEEWIKWWRWTGDINKTKAHLVDGGNF